MKIIQKNELKNGFYYSGHHLINGETYTVNQQFPTLIGKWDEASSCFWFEESESDNKYSMKYVFDSGYSREGGFFPNKEITD